MPSQSIEELEAEIASLEKKLLREPIRQKEEEVRKLTTMPASDELLEQQREKMHSLDLLSKGEVHNTRISQGKDLVLLIFFLLALVSIVGWILSSLQQV